MLADNTEKCAIDFIFKEYKIDFRMTFIIK